MTRQEVVDAYMAIHEAHDTTEQRLALERQKADELRAWGTLRAEFLVQWDDIEDSTREAMKLSAAIRKATAQNRPDRGASW